MMLERHAAQSAAPGVKIWLSCACFGLLALAGCAGNGTAGSGGPESERRDILAELAVEVATIKLVEARPELGPRVVAIAMITAQAIGAGEAATVAAAKQAVERRIGWDQLMPTERLLAQTLIDLVAADLDAMVAGRHGGLGDPLVQAEAAALLERIVVTAALVGRQPAGPAGLGI